MTTKVLSDEEIDRLLQEAEVRLREKAGQVTAPADDNEISIVTGEEKIPKASKLPSADAFSLPKLRHGLERASYIKEHNGVAQADPQALIGPTQKQLADGLRTVEQSTKSKKVVSGSTLKPSPAHHMRKLIPNYTSMQTSSPFWPALLP
jgi:hypothetical protein